MRERDPELSEGRLARLLFLDKGNDFKGGVERGVGTDPLVMAGAGKWEGRGVASSWVSVGTVDLTSSSTFMGTRSPGSSFLRSIRVTSKGTSGM